MGKRADINLEESQLPLYDLKSGIIGAIAQMGYLVENITVNKSEANSEEDFNMTIVNFKLSGVPIMTSAKLFEGDEVNIAVGSGTVSIHTVETTTENVYYVEDVVTSTFTVEDQIDMGNKLAYTSKALDSLFFALLKSCIIINNTVTTQA